MDMPSTARDRNHLPLIRRPLAVFVLLGLALVGVAVAAPRSADAPPRAAGKSGAKAPVPGAVALEAAQKKVGEVFGADLARAKTAEEDLALAARLAQSASDTADDPAARYVLLQTAAQRTAAAGKLSAALALVDRLGSLYDADVLALKADLLAYTAELLKSGKRKLAEGESLIDAFWSLLDEAEAAYRYGLAKQVAELGVAGARMARNLELARQFTERSREIDKLRKQYEPVAAALEALESDPVDPAANHTVGSWRCFHQGDWARGLPMLALGSDPHLAALAQRELKLAPRPSSPAPAPADLLALADAWAEFARTQPGPVKTEALAHAVACVQLALPALSGLDKAAAEKRLADLEAAAADLPSTGSAARGVVQKGNVALASNGTTVTSVGKPIEMAADLLDGVTQPVRNAGHAYSAWPCEWIITFPKVYRLQQIRFRLWDMDDRHYRYAVATSADGRAFVPLVDRSQGEWRGWQVLPFPPRPVKAVKLLGLYNSADSNFFVVEFEAYCVPPRLPR